MSSFTDYALTLQGDLEAGGAFNASRMRESVAAVNADKGMHALLEEAVEEEVGCVDRCKPPLGTPCSQSREHPLKRVR